MTTRLPLQLPRLTEARAALTREVEVVDEHGARGTVSIPAERDLTVYVDRRELVTLMTLGAQPELLVLGYLLNQRHQRDEFAPVHIHREIALGGNGNGAMRAMLIDDLDLARQRGAGLGETWERQRRQRCCHCAFFGAGLTVASGCTVLGGDAAVVAGECAPEASSGFASGGVKAKGPGSVQGGVATAAGAGLAAEAALARYLAATRSCAWQSL